MIQIILVAAIVALAVLLLRPFRRFAPRIGAIPWVPQRAFSYTLIFAALLAVLFAISNVLALLIGAVTDQLSAGMSDTDVRSSVSLSLAALLIGLPIWLGLWRREQRHVSAQAGDRHAVERRLFLGAVFASTAIIALFALQTVLQALLTLPAPASEHPAVLDSFSAGTRLVLFGAAWVVYARIGWGERPARSVDWVHDLALYVSAVFALWALGQGLYDAMHAITVGLVGQNEVDVSAVSRSAWATWGESLSWLLAGGLLWTAFLRYDVARGARHVLRIAYLYLVLAYTAAMTFGSGTVTLSEALHQVFGWHPPEGDWVFLSDLVPAALTGGVIVAIHWLLLRHESVSAGLSHPSTGGIPWPRRPAVMVMALTGITMATVGAGILLWVGLNALCASAVTDTGSAWWQEALSSGIAVGLVGVLVWLPSWLIAQRAATAAPIVERPALERRLLLWTVLTAGSLSALGFAVALVWLLLRTVLGGPQDATTLADALQYLSYVLLAVGVVTYHGLILRQDRAYHPAPVVHLRAVAYLLPGAEDVLLQLRRDSGQGIEVAGYLTAGTIGSVADMGTLAHQLATLGTDGHTVGVLVLLQPGGGTLYPYTRATLL